MVALQIGGVVVGLDGLDGALLARVQRRYARFLVEQAPHFRLALQAGRDGPHRPDGDPLVERVGARSFRIGYGGLSAELDLAAARGQATLPPSVYVVDSLLRMAMGLILVERGGLLVHGSGVLVGGRALVCFGPSGVGKTTVARSVAEELVLCDEMIALIPDGDELFAHGTPFHGDYSVCAPLTAPLHSLVRLVQGDVDRLETLSPAVAAQALLGSTLFFCRDDEMADALLSSAIRVCARGMYRLTFQRGTHVPTFIGEATDAGAQAAGPLPRR